MCILHSGLAGRELYKHHMQLGNVSERCVLSRLGFPRHKNSSTRVTFAGTCLLPEGGRRRAWHITAVQLPPDQLRRPLFRTLLQAFLPDADFHSWNSTTIPAPTKGTAELYCLLSFHSHIKSLSFLLSRQDLPTKQAAGTCLFITQLQ